MNFRRQTSTANAILSRSVCNLCLLLMLLGSSSVYAQSEELFPRPPELQPAVDFWVKVYTEVDTQSGYLHDARNLTIIYERLPNNRRQINSARNRIQADLRALASGQRDSLSGSQQELLALWGADVSNQVLREAASNVRWQLGQSDRFLGGLKRSGAYRAHINEVIREKGLPIELGVLPHVESSFNPRAFSSAAAAGMWQFGRATGQRFMRIDHIVDERMDPYTATYAAMSLLEYNYSVLGTWPLALTAYNHGAGGISRAVRQTGTRAIEDIVGNYRGRRFGFASRNFYAQFLAVIEVENNARQYFGDVRLDPAPRFETVTTDAFIDAEVFARSVGLSLEQLQSDNPSLRPAVWEGNKRIPADFQVKVRDAAVPGRNLLAQIPADYKFDIQTPDVAYVVERGDSLSVIARRFNTSVARLAALNQLASRHRIQIGQRLLLPQENGQPAVRYASMPPEGVYTVSREDTVTRIAARFDVTERELLGANGIRDRNRIYPGQQLTLPGFEDLTERVVIAASDRPVPPTVVQFADESLQTEARPVAVAAVASVANTPSPEPAVVNASDAVNASREPVQLARTESILPPAAVLPDHVELEMPVTLEEEQAVALDPAVDLNETNAQLTEALAADPSDYTVAGNNSIEIQASETLGHFADWLGIRAWDIRRLNNMAFRDPVIIGERLTLDFSRVNSQEFERRRREFHSSLQQEFFSSFRIQNVETYQVSQGDNIGRIARGRYSTPIWLLRQYNPTLDFNRIQIGQEIVFPLVERVN